MEEVRSVSAAVPQRYPPPWKWRITGSPSWRGLGSVVGIVSVSSFLFLCPDRAHSRLVRPFPR